MGSYSDGTEERFTLTKHLDRWEDTQKTLSAELAELVIQARNLMNQLFTAIQTVVDETKNPDLVVSHPWVQERLQLSYKDTTVTIQFAESGRITVKKTKADKAVPLDVQLTMDKQKDQHGHVVLGLYTMTGVIVTPRYPLDAQSEELHKFLAMCLP